MVTINLCPLNLNCACFINCFASNDLRTTKICVIILMIHPNYILLNMILYISYCAVILRWKIEMLIMHWLQIVLLCTYTDTATCYMSWLNVLFWYIYVKIYKNCKLSFIKEENENNTHFTFIISAPDFVSSLEDRDHVYFFFREAAVEYINCGKVSHCE